MSKITLFGGAYVPETAYEAFLNAVKKAGYTDLATRGVNANYESALAVLDSNGDNSFDYKDYEAFAAKTKIDRPWQRWVQVFFTYSNLKRYDFDQYLDEISAIQQIFDDRRTSEDLKVTTLQTRLPSALHRFRDAVEECDSKANLPVINEFLATSTPLPKTLLKLMRSGTAPCQPLAWASLKEMSETARKWANLEPGFDESNWTAGVHFRIFQEMLADAFKEIASVHNFYPPHYQTEALRELYLMQLHSRGTLGGGGLPFHIKNNLEDLFTEASHSPSKLSSTITHYSQVKAAYLKESIRLLKESQQDANPQVRARALLQIIPLISKFSNSETDYQTCEEILEASFSDPDETAHNAAFEVIVDLNDASSNTRYFSPAQRLSQRLITKAKEASSPQVQAKNLMECALIVVVNGSTSDEDPVSTFIHERTQELTDAKATDVIALAEALAMQFPQAGSISYYVKSEISRIGKQLATIMTQFMQNSTLSIEVRQKAAQLLLSAEPSHNLYYPDSGPTEANVVKAVLKAYPDKNSLIKDKPGCMLWLERFFSTTTDDHVVETLLKDVSGMMDSPLIPIEDKKSLLQLLKYPMVSDTVKLVANRATAYCLKLLKNHATLPPLREAASEVLSKAARFTHMPAQRRDSILLELVKLVKPSEDFILCVQILHEIYGNIEAARFQKTPFEPEGLTAALQAIVYNRQLEATLRNNSIDLFGALATQAACPDKLRAEAQKILEKLSNDPSLDTALRTYAAETLEAVREALADSNKNSF